AESELVERARGWGRGRRGGRRRRGTRRDLRRFGFLCQGEEAAAVAHFVDRQRVERLLAAAAEERRQRDVEDALERRPAHEVGGLLAAELEQRVAVDRGDPAVRVEREHALARGSDEL